MKDANNEEYSVFVPILNCHCTTCVHIKELLENNDYVKVVKLNG